MSAARVLRGVWVLAALAAAAALVVAWLNVRGEAPLQEAAASSSPSTPDAVARGTYLARAGNCIGCHTDSVAGGAAFAGGRGVHTPFGTVYAPNITPDAATGIGAWSAAEFWRAMHHGRSKDGRLLYPAFPYPSFTQVTREDSDALYAYLRSVPAVNQPNTPHALRFPYRTQAALAVWRALFFRPAAFTAEPGQGQVWNRGKYLVQGLGHCAACHSTRNFLGATRLNAEFAGGLMPDTSWYAPSLASADEAGVQAWPRPEVVKLLKSGVSARGSATGPMAEVVFSSTQHLSEADLDAVAQYLQSIAPQPVPVRAFERAPADRNAAGARVYENHCAACHGSRGEGVPSIYPPLAGNRAVTMVAPNNVVQIIRHGGFAPTTTGNPRPFGMPPFAQVLSDDDVAAVSSFVRQSWGNAAPAVSALDVLHIR